MSERFCRLACFWEMCKRFALWFGTTLVFRWNARARFIKQMDACSVVTETQLPSQGGIALCLAAPGRGRATMRTILKGFF